MATEKRDRTVSAIPKPISKERKRWPGDEGYDRMGFARSVGWHAVSSWGRDGWDLGGWPLVVVYHRTRMLPISEGGVAHELATDVEGDIDVERFNTPEDRDRRTDEIALFYWRVNGDEWARGDFTAETMPEHLRGPYSPARAEAVST